MSNNVSHRRRKWSFEKGRNSKSVILAAISTAAVFALVLGGFKYEFHSPAEKRQSTEVSLILSGDWETLSRIDKYDPTAAFRINTGGFPFCRYCRRSHAGRCPAANGELEIDLQVDLTAAIPEYEHDVRSTEIVGNALPASGQYAPVLPHPQSSVRYQQSQVTAADGEVLEFAQLSGVSAVKAKGASVIAFSGEGLLMLSEIIQSCGDDALDQQAVRILKSAGIRPGTYTIHWQGGE